MPARIYKAYSDTANKADIGRIYSLMVDQMKEYKSKKQVTNAL